MERAMRYIVALFGVLVGYPLGRFIIFHEEIMEYIPIKNHILIYAIVMIATGLILFFLYPILLRALRNLTEDIGYRTRNKNLLVLVPQIIGLILGLVLAFLLSSAFNSFPIPGWQWVISVSLYFIIGYIGWTLPTYHRVDLSTWFMRLRKNRDIPVETKVEINSDNKEIQPKILDTSVIIDGRIIDIYKTQFLEGTLVIPIYVLSELQLISDSSDDLKRSKGRRGLDIVAKLQNEYEDNIVILEEDYPELKDVDSKLIKTAKDLNYKIITNDYNLNKVASLQGIDILNINDLANAVKISVLPGEVIDVSLLKAGKEPGQAVAYLEDGTMIVVENSKHLIGKDLPVIVTSALQTSAGRMIFAKPKGV